VNSAECSICDLSSGDGLPVAGEEVPLYGGEVELVRDAKDCGTTGAVGGAEVADGSAERVFDCGVAVCEFFADAGGGLPGEPGVGHGVVADEVSGGCDGASDGGTLLDVAADEEERGAGVVAGEDFEETFGGDVVGTVVVGEGDFVWVLAGYEDFAEYLGLGGECGVGECACGGGGEKCCDSELVRCHVFGSRTIRLFG